jgi:hypothetical protein
MNKIIRVCLWICILGAASQAHAGHGFMNSFADVEWLPEPGRTPDQFGYRIDNWREQAELAFEADAQERFALSLEFAREKLAEIDAMVVATQPEAARTALTQYVRSLDSAEEALHAHTDDRRADIHLRYAKALLEHQYILSVNYLDLPRTSRPVVLEAMKTAGQRYAPIAAQLEAKVKESLFFKEEEVRWSTELAEQADIQGL